MVTPSPIGTTTEGSEVWEALKSDLHEAGLELTRTRRLEREADARVHDLLSQRGDALAKLARLELPEISRATVDRTFAAIRADLSSVLTRKEASERELELQIDSAADDAHRRSLELDDLTRRLDRTVAERERLEAQVASSLKQDDEFQTRTRLALQAEAQLHRNEQRVSEVEAEAAEKLPSYRSSRLFSYLHDRGYGTPAYTGRGWTASVDSWVARRIDYDNARASYEFLVRTPALVAGAVARQRTEFEDLMKQVEDRQKIEADRVGLSAVLGEGETLGSERDRLAAELEKMSLKASQLRQARADLAGSQNPFYAEAIARLRLALGETQLAVLRQRAAETPGPDDDAAVQILGELDGQIRELSARLADVAGQRKAAERWHHGLDEVVRKYRLANFDSRRSTFAAGFDVRLLLNQFRDGVTDAETLWQTIRSAQLFRPHWVETTAAVAGEGVNTPGGRVLMGAIVDAAGKALQESAERGLIRRGGGGASGQTSSVSTPTDARGGGGGFTSGQGF